jgi:hypothetical protein
MDSANCFDVGISRQVDSLGIPKWSVQLFKQTDLAFLPTNGDVPTNPLRIIFRCQGVPHYYFLQIRYRQNVAADPYHAESVRVTGPGITDGDLDDALDALREVPVDNTSDVYTSQVWVFDALDAMYDMELFPDDDFEEAHAFLSRRHQAVGDRRQHLQI